MRHWIYDAGRQNRHAPSSGRNLIILFEALARTATPTLRISFKHFILRAVARVLGMAGKRSAINVAMIEITTCSSISVNPERATHHHLPSLPKVTIRESGPLCGPEQKRNSASGI